MNSLDKLGVFLGLLTVVIILLPPRWDPTIRIKEWQIKQGRHPESRLTKCGGREETHDGNCEDVL
jgi:hypothetical protein